MVQGSLNHSVDTLDTRIKDQLIVIGLDAQKQKERMSYERSAGIIGMGKIRVTAEFIEICSRSGSMTDLTQICMSRRLL